ncbi:MAG: CheB methylesterase domain-containing protein, partial [Acidobacteriota bacterium]
SPYDLIVIGASTGGPPTIQQILEDLGSELAVPVVIVQHMPVGFTRAFAERLNAYLPLLVREASPAELLLPGTIYIAPAGTHVRVRRYEDDYVVELGTYPSNVTHIPSVDILFQSAAQAAGNRAVGALLTGMGRDGALGLAALRAGGAHTLVQDEDSCVVFGMPRAALALNNQHDVLPAQEIGGHLRALVDGEIAQLA